MRTITRTLALAATVSMVALAAHAATPDLPIANDGANTQVQAPNFQRARQIPVVDSSVQVQQQGEVRFVTGGIGDDERSEIEAMKSDFNFYVQSASKDGAYVEAADVTITNKAGEVVLQTTAGPLLYVCLPTGRYVLKAQLGEQVLTHKFSITAKKTAHAHLGWNVQGNPSTDADAMKTY